MEAKLIRDMWRLLELIYIKSNYLTITTEGSCNYLIINNCREQGNIT